MPCKYLGQRCIKYGNIFILFWIFTNFIPKMKNTTNINCTQSQYHNLEYLKIEKNFSSYTYIQSTAILDKTEHKKKLHLANKTKKHSFTDILIIIYSFSFPRFSYYPLENASPSIIIVVDIVHSFPFLFHFRFFI
jgi:hypothetical protein